MTENEITKDLLDASIKLHRRFGPGLLESVYERLLTIELEKRGHVIECQKSIDIEYEDVRIENAFRLDMLVDKKVIVELKSTEQMNPVYLKQVKTYLVLTNLTVGVLINFGQELLKNGFVRVVNGYIDKPPKLSASAPLREINSPLLT